jgi:hypothetical protein
VKSFIDCHPERSLAVSEANRQAESKDPYSLAVAVGAARNSHRRMRPAFVLVALFVLAAQAQTFRNFPGRKSDLTSPSGRYVIQNVERDEGRPFVLSVKDKTTHKSRTVYQYGRCASVLWSPDSRHFAIADAASSDYTQTKIIPVDESAPEIDVQKEILDKVNSVPDGHHEYFYVAYWIDSRRTVIYHWGYGGELPDGFCECYVYRLNGPVRRCARQPKDSDRVCSQTILGR